MTGFVLSRRALDDLRGIARDTEARWGRAQRNHYLAEFDALFQRLAAHPQSGPVCAEPFGDYRKFPLGAHLIFYRQQGDTLRVVRILHQRMDWPQRLKES